MLRNVSSERSKNKNQGSFKNFIRISGLICFALLLVIGLASCSGKDESMEVVAEVNGKQIYRWELDRLYDRNIEEFEANRQLDLSNPKNATVRKDYREDLLNTLIDDVYITEAAKLDGYDLTEEEKVQFEKDFDETIEKNIVALMKNYEDDPDARKKAEKDYADLLKENNITMDFLKMTEYNSKVRLKLSEVLFEGLVPSDEELKESFEQYIENQKEVYEDNPDKYNEQYFSSAQNPDNYTVVYNPPGFRRVKQIMIYFPEEIDEKLRAITKEQTDVLLKQQELIESKGSTDPAVQEYERQIQDMRVVERELFIEARVAVMDKVEAVEKALQDGRDFDDVLLEYGEDEDMLSGQISEIGYLVGPGSKLLPEIITAASGMKKVGDVSERIETVNGYHFLEAVEIIDEGAVDFEQAKPFLSDLMTQTPRTVTLDEYLELKKSEYSEGDDKFEVKINKQNIG